MTEPISSRIWPVAAIPSLDGNRKSPTQTPDQQPDQALVDKFTAIMDSKTTATISPEAEALLAAERAGATVTWAPLDPAIQRYLEIGRT